MRIIMGNRSSSSTSLAGDVVQQHRTAEALRQMGMDVVIALGDLSDVSGDIVHLFNIMPVEDTYQLFCQAKAKGVPVVLSPIYWDPYEFLHAESNPNSKFFEDWWDRTRAMRIKLLQEVELLLPNGRGEIDKLICEFGGEIAAHKVIPNAADKSFAFADPGKFRRHYSTDAFILCVGRICRRKNQLGLIRALNRQSFNLIFIGPIDDYEYYRSCRRETTRCRLRFIDTLNQAELASAYAAADLHVLPSWYETPGLATLEAAMTGCKVVTTIRGTAKEYLGDYAWYCDPSQPESIRNAILAALQHPVNPRLREHVRQNYTWEKAANQTLLAYNCVLEGK